MAHRVSSVPDGAQVIGYASPTLSVAQVCEVLGCKRRQVFRLLSDGVLERAPRYGRELRIFRASVDRALLPPPAPGRKKRAPAFGDIPVARLEDLHI